MTKTLSLVIFGLLVLSIGIVSACDSSCPVGKTLITGKIYEQDTGKGVKGADVEIICHGENGDVSKTTTSVGNGKYLVLFSQNECEYGDSVTINANKGGLIGTSTGIIDKQLGGRHCFNLDIGVFNVPLVPEFGLIIGGLTILSAIGVFFFVRRE